MSTLLHGLIDCAAVFPPGNASMPDAVAEYRTWRAGPRAGLIGRFVCPASRVPELTEQLTVTDLFELGVVADTGLDALADVLHTVWADPRLRLASVEIAVPAGGGPGALVRATQETLSRLPTVTPSFIEVPRSDGWREALRLIGDAARGAKLRTGGPSAAMFPTESEVAEFIGSCVADNVPFKCTAGLHRAVRHTDPATGFEHHGYLNIILATAAAIRGDDAHIADALAERNPPAVAEQVAALDPVAAGAVRAHFIGFGSCSVEEPAADVEKLGLFRLATGE